MADRVSRPWRTTRNLLRTVARAVRHAPDRLLHGRRHRTALEQLARLRPRSVLIVCRGNLCRSPYAEDRLRTALDGKLPARVTIRSAGFLAPGQRPPEGAIGAAWRMGVDLGRHRSRQLSGDLIRQADLVLTMEPEQQRAIDSVCQGTAATVMLLGDFDPQPVTTRAIPDPYGRPPETFLTCFRQIDRCVHAVASCLRGASPLVG